jgi:nicotinamide-nucleotide amidase
MRREVELVTTGTELLIGRTVNRHAFVLGDRLGTIGFNLVRDTTVRDDASSIREAIQSALERSDVVFVSGGLGPTSDDITRDVLAEFLRRKVVSDSPALQAMTVRYQKLGRVVTEQARRQALVLEGACVLPNPVGMAPGERIDLDGKVLFLLPGPPREFSAILEEHVLPWLREKAGGAPVAEHVFLLCGIGESDIANRLEQAGFNPPGVEIAYCAAPGRIEVRLTSLAGDVPAVEKAAAVVRPLLGEFVFTEERAEMEDVVGRLLRQHEATLATAESCTGGLIGHRITSVGGSSDYYLGGVIAYSNEVKFRDLGVSENTLNRQGAVSEEVARQMAVGVQKKFNADYGLSITGIAGPTGGTPEKPVGLVYVAVADRTRSWVRRYCFASDRTTIKMWSSQMALDLLRRRLRGILKDES